MCVHICSIYIYKYKYLFTDGLFLVEKKKTYVIWKRKVGKKKKVLTPPFRHFIVKAHYSLVIVRFKGNESSFFT